MQSSDHGQILILVPVPVEQCPPIVVRRGREGGGREGGERREGGVRRGEREGGERRGGRSEGEGGRIGRGEREVM